MSRVFVSIVVDDLDARQDPQRSARTSTYAATAEELAACLKLIRKFKDRGGSAGNVQVIDMGQPWERAGFEVAR